MDYADILELDKKIVVHEAWLAGSPYRTLLIANENTFREMFGLADSFFNEEERTYKGFPTQIDSDLDDGIVVLTSKKGDNV